MSGKRPLQQRAIQTRQRLYEAALDEFERVGVGAARVEDIVATAGVSWGTFFRYFPRKEDVLIEFAGQMGRAFASSARSGLERGDPTVRIAADALAEAGMAPLSRRPALRKAMLHETNARPEMLAAYLAQQGAPSMVDTMTDILEKGQRRGEVRDDYPARAMAQITIAAVFGAYWHELNDDTPLGIQSGRGTDSYVSLMLGLVADGFVPRPDNVSAVPRRARPQAEAPSQPSAGRRRPPCRDETPADSDRRPDRPPARQSHLVR